MQAHGMEFAMYMVYWTVVENDESTARAEPFGSHDMAGAMRLMEELRARQRAGEAIRFIALSSENPESVGPAGVAEPDPDYQWKKRRR
jgi:hypothetical protein